MVIKRSSAREVAGLLGDLTTGADRAREAAIARLSVIGTRAVSGLLSLLESPASVDARVGALTALEAIGDPRATDQAFMALTGSEPLLRTPAASLLRRLLDSPRGSEILDRLAALTLDSTQPDAVRVAALGAMQEVAPSVMAPVVGRLKDDASVTVRAMVSGTPSTTAARPPLEAIEAAAEGALPDDPAALRQWLSAEGHLAALPVLHKLVLRIREHESSRPDGPDRREWMTARAAVHQVLAAQGSTVARYDLCETIESGVIAPVEMLAALATLGDRSCLEPIAMAYGRLLASPAAGARKGTARDESTWWREHLVSTFRTIAAREKVTDRHALAKKIRARWPDAATALLAHR